MSQEKFISGFINASAVQFEYHHASNPVLTWTEPGDARHQELSTDHIVGVLPRDPKNAFDILFVEVPQSSSDKPRESCTRFCTLTVRDPPAELIQLCGPPGHFFKSLLSESAAPALHVVVSVASGQRHAESCFKSLVEPFLAHSGLRDRRTAESARSYAVHRTTSADSLTSIAREIFRPNALAGQQQCVILLAGDGGVVELLGGLLGDDGSPKALPPSFVHPVVALLPLGTGNALAHSSLAARGATLGLAALFRGARRPLPLFDVHFNPPAKPIVPPFEGDEHPKSSPQALVTRTAGAVVFSWALHAALVADSDTPEYRKHGAARFPLAAKANLAPPDGSPPHAYSGSVEIQAVGGDGVGVWKGVPDDGAHSYVLATLCTRLEATFTVSPASVPLDQTLRFLRIPGYIAAKGQDRAGERVRTTGARIGELMAGGYAGGTHVDEEEVQYEAVRALKLRIDEEDDAQSADAAGGRGRWRRVCIDGRIFEVAAGGTVLVEGPAMGVDGELCTALDVVHFS